jgi:hypothetical protein
VHAEHYSYITFQDAVFNIVICLSRLHTAFQAALYSTLTKPATAHARAGYCVWNITLPLLIISKDKTKVRLEVHIIKALPDFDVWEIVEYKTTNSGS